MNKFGGNWTKRKIEILVEYAKAYLTIMNDKKYFKLLYFDGFAGSGVISQRNRAETNIIVGAARRIIEIENPRSFDEYYFVDTSKKNINKLIDSTKKAFPNKVIHIVKEDCNTKLQDLSIFLQKSENKNYRTLAYIDPSGMQLSWSSLECLKGLNIDIWILVPTGLGVNRLLKNNGMISDAWLKKLELFLGMESKQIEEYFYTKTPTLFPDIIETKKEYNTIQKSAILYQKRLEDIFDYVSKPYELKNSTNSIMFHLFLTSNNKTAITIGNDIVKKYNN